MVSDFPRVPRSIMNACRDESTIEMHIFDGNLPDDLPGHVFIVAPVGTVNSGGLPDKNGNTFMNGDGMIYRLDFNLPTVNRFFIFKGGNYDYTSRI